MEKKQKQKPFAPGGGVGDPVLSLGCYMDTNQRSGATERRDRKLCYRRLTSDERHTCGGAGIIKFQY